MFARAAAMFAAMLLSACNSVSAGQPCDEPGDLSCESASMALICQTCRGALQCARGTDSWQQIPCRGANGCSSTRCDQSGNVASDPCPDADEGRSFCKDGGDTTLMTCTNHVLVQQSCVSGCIASTTGEAACR